jgi:hypothetical protein
MERPRGAVAAVMGNAKFPTSEVRIAPAPAKGSSGRCQSEKEARRSHLQVQIRNGNARLEWLPIAFSFAEGPRVRIRLPPAVSPSHH